MCRGFVVETLHTIESLILMTYLRWGIREWEGKSVVRTTLTMEDDAHNLSSHPIAIFHYFQS